MATSLLSVVVASRSSSSGGSIGDQAQLGAYLDGAIDWFWFASGFFMADG
jgi:hypothetical protein